MDEQRPLEICINSHGPVVSVFETFGSNREIEKIAGTDSLTVAIKGPGLDRTMKPHQGDIGAVGGRRMRKFRNSPALFPGGMEINSLRCAVMNFEFHMRVNGDTLCVRDERTGRPGTTRQVEII